MSALHSRNDVHLLFESYSTELVWAHKPSVEGEEVAEEKWMKSSANETPEHCSVKWVESSKCECQV